MKYTTIAVNKEKRERLALVCKILKRTELSVIEQFIDCLWVLCGTKNEGAGLWLDIKNSNSAILTVYGSDKVISGKNSLPTFSESEFIEKVTKK